MEKQKESFIGCTKCYRKKKDCKCKSGDLHRIPKRRFDYWKFELVKNSCGKMIMNSTTNKDNAVYCGDVEFSDIQLCTDCESKLNSEGKFFSSQP